MNFGPLNNPALVEFVRLHGNTPESKKLLLESLVVETIITSYSKSGVYNKTMAQTRTVQNIGGIGYIIQKPNERIVAIKVDLDTSNGVRLTEDSKLEVDSALISAKFLSVSSHLNNATYVDSIITYVYLNDKYDPLMSAHLFAHIHTTKPPVSMMQLYKKFLAKGIELKDKLRNAGLPKLA